MSDRPPIPFSPEPDLAAAPSLELVARAHRHAPTDGVHDTALGALQLIRASAPTQPLPTVYEPGLVVVLQGRKQATLAGRAYHYEPGHALVVAVTLPLLGQVLEATPARPYLCMRMALNLPDLADLMLAAPGPQAMADGGGCEPGLHVAAVDAALTDALLRWLRLLDAPADAPVLGPLIEREIHYRVLTGALGPRLREITQVDGRARRIAGAVALIRSRYAEPLRVQELADAAHMSESSLHHHFKQLTAMSPLQFQKHLRLHQARRLLLGEGLDAAAAAHRVGYESPSHFSREYRRLFGAAPGSDRAKWQLAGPVR